MEPSQRSFRMKYQIVIRSKFNCEYLLVIAFFLSAYIWLKSFSVFINEVNLKITDKMEFLKLKYKDGR